MRSLFQRHAVLLDVALSLVLILASLGYSFLVFDYNAPPFEDAAMLMRYASHLARGHGIVWNIGEAPVDGATDFLFMVSVAALAKLGIGVGRSVRLLTLVSHLLTILLVYWVNRRLWGAGRFPAAWSALYLAAGPGFAYVIAYFGTPFFALAIALTWTLGLLLTMRRSAPFWLELTFAFTALLSGLIRPDGVILVTLILLAIIFLRGWKDSARLSFIFLMVFLLFGGAYFLWRWQYFGHPLPNPFYKKGGGVLHWDAMFFSLRNTLRFIAPFLPAFVLGFRSPQHTRRALAFLLPVVGFSLAFVLISDEMNYRARFQYVLLPLALLSWYPLVQELEFGWRRPLSFRERVSATLAGLLIAAAGLSYSAVQNCFLTYHRNCFGSYADGRAEIGKMLAAFRDKGYVLATSEAGLIPYYSGWTAIDTWGLNDPWIAKQGEITEAYLDRYRPHVIMFHAYFSPLVPPKPEEKERLGSWDRMTILLKEYAETRGYILAAVYGENPFDTHYYYVRPDFEDSVLIVRQIRNLRYVWPVSGTRAFNYARVAEK